MTHWAAHFESLEACVTPVLNLREARAHALNLDFFESDGPRGAPTAPPHLFPIS